MSAPPRTLARMMEGHEHCPPCDCGTYKIRHCKHEHNVWG